MEEQKIIKEIGLGGREITFIIDPSLNGVAEKMKLPKKYENFNEVDLPIIQKFMKEQGRR